MSRERAFERIVRSALADDRLRSIEMRQEPGDTEIRALVRVEGADSGERMAIEMKLRLLIAENVSSLGMISVRVETA